MDLNFYITILSRGVRFFSDRIANKYPNLTVNNCLIEEYKSPIKFDNIIISHVLEHVYKPENVILKTYDLLNTGGRLFVSVPNANSLHRQIAQNMGLIKSVNDFSEKDKHHGHRKIFDLHSLNQLFTNYGGLGVIAEGGYYLKPFTDSMINNMASDELLKGLMDTGEAYPEISVEIYIILEKT
jgi:2-polyprenyl-3-methyl-5-hydroxy-6-metoxy-1,4-benzoquinol methylase